MVCASYDFGLGFWFFASRTWSGFGWKRGFSCLNVLMDMGESYGFIDDICREQVHVSIYRGLVCLLECNNELMGE